MAADPADGAAERTPANATRHASLRRVALGFVAVALLASVGGVLASARIKSPQQRIADAEGPGVTLLTAPVEFRVLDSGLIVNGQVTATATVAFTPTPGPEGGGVVTALPKAVGARVDAGEVVAEIDGRPVVALPGGVPSYRDLRPGTHGRDVVELQRALRALGEDPLDEEGVFGPGTKAAIARLYDRLGYDPALAGDEADLRALRSGVRTAERAREDARSLLANTPVTSPERKAAEVTRRRAAEDLAEARAELAQAQATGASAADLHALSLAVRSAVRALEDARSALAALPKGSPERDAARLALRRADEDLATARGDLASAQATSGAMLPASEAVFVPYLPARVSAIGSAVGGKIGTEPLLTITGGALVVDVEVQEGDLGKVAKRSAVEVTVDAGPAVPGRVSGVGPVQVSDTGQRVARVRVSTDQPLPESSYGKVVRLAIKPEEEPAEAWVVPLAAVFSDAEDQAFVAVVADDVRTRIAVTVDQISDGYASITPKQDGLEVGAEVVVGTVAQNSGARP